MPNPKLLASVVSSPSSNSAPASHRKMCARLFRSILFLLTLSNLPAMQIEFTLDRLLPALIHVESGGDDHAVNYHEEAIGCLQITKAVVADFNARHKNERYEHHEMFEREKAVRVCRWYLSYWSQKQSPDPSLEKLARIWNGGPSGHQKTSTVKYWEKVKLFLPPQ
jgi:hypothetical protein